MENDLNLLSNRAGFNSALRHFKTVNAFAADINDGYNLADVINQALSEDTIERYQVRAILNALLVDKFGYAFEAHNMFETVESVDKLIERTSKWGNLQIVLAYHHPQAGVFVINPKNESHWEDSLPLIKDELVVVYVGSADGSLEAKTLKGAVEDFIKLIYGRSIKDKSAYLGEGKVKAPVSQEPSPPPSQEPQGQAETQAQAPETAPSGGKKRRITPRYSVLVTNELFHNGNVEAWKRIIESYKGKYPGLDVLIWYENERINDINSLFKWGKVKHGTPIMFSVVGEDIKGVAKLQRYLFEGASPRFEVFLRGGVGRTLDLF
ncbi:MAG: hypothetical protein GVY29_02700 [Spirochaetes bacterium]|jgi:hypothetical protein|nr:hypothetical protein [Spirochaetota bacterium]